MIHHIKVDHQASTDSSYHTSITHNHTDAMTEFDRLCNIWPERFITISSYNDGQPKFITSNDKELNERFEQKRLTGSEHHTNTPAHIAITQATANALGVSL